MVGDRYLTDVVFGNRNSMLTIRPAPFTAKGEPKAVLLVSLARRVVPGKEPPSRTPLLLSTRKILHFCFYQAACF